MSNDECHTPNEFFEKLAKHFNFTLDAAATKRNTKCQKFITRKQDAFATPWKTKGWVWLNYPFSREAGGSLRWIQRVYEQVMLEKNCAGCVSLGIADVSTAAYAHAFSHASEIIHLSPRINFPSPGKTDRSGGLQAYYLAVWRQVCKGQVTSLWDWKNEDFTQRLIRYTDESNRIKGNNKETGNRREAGKRALYASKCQGSKRKQGNRTLSCR